MLTSKFSHQLQKNLAHTIQSVYTSTSQTERSTYTYVPATLLRQQSNFRRHFGSRLENGSDPRKVHVYSCEHHAFDGG